MPSPKEEIRMIIGKPKQNSLGLVFTATVPECPYQWRLLSLGFIDYDKAEDADHLPLQMIPHDALARPLRWPVAAARIDLVWQHPIDHPSWLLFCTDSLKAGLEVAWRSDPGMVDQSAADIAQAAEALAKQTAANHQQLNKHFYRGEE
jgi:hypothetical protein